MILEEVVLDIYTHLTKDTIHYVWNKVFPEEKLSEELSNEMIEDLKEELTEYFDVTVNESKTIEIYNYLFEEDLTEIEEYVISNLYNDFEE